MFWVLVFSFMYLVLVDATDRSFNTISFSTAQTEKISREKIGENKNPCLVVWSHELINSEKMIISTGCICGFMPNLAQKILNVIYLKCPLFSSEYSYKWWNVFSTGWYVRLVQGNGHPYSSELSMKFVSTFPIFFL